MSATFNIPGSSRGSVPRMIHRSRLAGPSRTSRLSAFLLFLIVISSVSSGAQTCVEPPSGILAWWPLEETSGTIAQDIAGTHPAARFGAPVPAAGKVGGSLRFHGNDFLGAADSNLWAFAGRSFTIELWANFDAPVGGSVGHPGAIFIGNDEGPGGRAKWFFALGEGFLNFHINSPALGPKFFPLALFSPEVGHWYHLAVTRNGNLYTLFVDGTPVGSAINDDLIPDPNVSLTIGQAESLGFVHGRLDELTVYGRALTEVEVQAIAAAGSAGKCKDTSDIQGAVFPTKGGDTGSVTVRISGRGFAEGTTVRLTREENIDIAGNPVQILDDLTISTSFDLQGRTRGAWDVLIENPDGSFLSLSDAFTIEEGDDPQLWVDIVGRGAVRAGRPHQFHLIFGNRGNVDVIGVPIWVYGIPRDATLTFDFSILPPPFPEREEPVDWSSIPVRFQAGESDAIALLVPRIAGGATKSLSLNISVPLGFTTSPVTSLTELEMNLHAWANPPLHSPNTTLGWLEIVECLKEIGVKVADLRLPGAGCALTIFDHATQWLADRTFQGAETFSWSDFVTEFTIDCTDQLVSTTEKQKIVFELLQGSVDGYKIHTACRDALRQISEIRRPVRIVASFDPNIKSGSQGSGDEQFISGAHPLPYTILFENLATASAPAQEVTIRDLLDIERLDLRTLNLGPISFGNQRVIPPNGSRAFTTIVDLRPVKNLLVRIEANLDVESGLLTWKFTSIDPATGGLPEDPFSGFLPPNVNPPEGEGSVLFTVMPRQDLSTGAEIRNRASIVFDTNAPIETQQWLNTIDKTSPSSQVLPLTSLQNSLDFEVTWSGTDMGSGIKHYSLFVSEDGGPYRTWLVDTALTSAKFHGVSGRSYLFYSIATDLTENLEEVSSVPDSSTQVATLPPEIHSISPNSGPTEGGTSVTIRGSGFAAGALVAIGGVTATDLVVEDATAITVQTTPHETGACDVTVTNPDGLGATLARSFFYSPPSIGLDFYTVTPCRVVDTRWAEGPVGAPTLAPSEQRLFKATEACGIPSSAKAIVANLTVVSPTGGGYLSVFPGNAFFLGTSVINFSPGRTRATNTILLLATDETGSFGVINSSGGSTHLVVDVSGYFE